MIAFTLILLSAAASHAQTPLVPLFPDDVRQHAERALHSLNMTMDDATFEKDHGKPHWSLSWITNTLSNPWNLALVAENIYTSTATADSGSLWVLSANLLEIPPPSDAIAPALGENQTVTAQNIPDLFYGMISSIPENLDRVFSAIDTSNKIYLSAFVLSPVFETEDNVPERELLAAAGIPRAYQERVEAESRLLDGTEVSLAWLDQINNIDLPELHRSAQSFHHAVELIKQCAANITEWPEQVVTNETDAGRIIVGTKHNDVYDVPALLILDPGGNDVYLNGAGVANGLKNHPLAAIIDIAGDDQYHSTNMMGAGAALWGISVVLDDNGNDVYESSGLGSGTGIYGAGWLEDAKGQDRYSGRAIGEGAGIVGFGFLIDDDGDDHYDIGIYGQGFSGVKGIGLLVDRAGNDRYFAGNLQLDHERNDARYLSLSQGFSIGLRPHAGGGVAALVDLAGNDTYTADIYGQGVSYYYSAGFLLDGSGQDRYSVYQYGQGCGIHLSLGVLADAGGDDMYSGYILSQGAAHDYAVGMLFDHAGNDTYTADQHAQGRALNNAFALLVDREGDDAYFGRRRDETQGVGNTAGYRDYGSLALLLDLAGNDLYSGGFTNNAVTLRPLYGVVYDHGDGAGDE